MQISIELKSLFASAVRQRRHELGVTQEELAWRAGLHRTYLANVESGTRNLSLQSIGKLARGLDLSLTGLFERMEKSSKATASDGDYSLLAKPVDILLIDHSSASIEATLKAFQEAKFVNHVHVVHDAATVLDFLLSPRRGRASPTVVRPHLILLDLALPKGAGIKLLQRIRSDPRTGNIPIIALMTVRRDKEIEECQRLGVDEFILQPLSFRSLSEITPRLKLNWALLKESA